MKCPFSLRVRFFLVHGRWPKREATLMLALTAAMIAMPPEPPTRPRDR